MESVTNFLLALRPKSSLLDKMGALSRDHAEGHGAQLAEASAGCCAAEKYRTDRACCSVFVLTCKHQSALNSLPPSILSLKRMLLLEVV